MHVFPLSGLFYSPINQDNGELTILYGTFLMETTWLMQIMSIRVKVSQLVYIYGKQVSTEAALPAERVMQRLLSIASNFSIKKAPLDSTSTSLNKRQSIRIIFTGISATSSKIAVR